MNDYTKIKENPDMILDESSGAILNTNIEAYNAFKMKNIKNKPIKKIKINLHYIRFRKAVFSSKTRNLRRPV